MATSDQIFMREHYEIMADIRAIKKDLIDGDANQEELLKKIIILEQKSLKNDFEHTGFVASQELAELSAAVRELKGGMVVMTPQQAKNAGNSWLSVLLKNPTYLMWVILGAIIITMVVMGYSFIEINQVLDKLH